MVERVGSQVAPEAIEAGLARGGTSAGWVGDAFTWDLEISNFMGKIKEVAGGTG